MGEDNDPLPARAYDDKMANYQSHAQKESLSFHSTTGLTIIQFTALVKSTHQLPELRYPKHQIPALILAQATL
ncbi:hypothetical protein HMPREF0742_00914 [Rothia aeria F0184]|uniref:Uncharacterized protein n=1 Tax=Rothia aeria F0184 TaxID=888019 RepID=U7V6Y0_9MICC|nr:hypothetical protein HMPREF0742_00914 [Rothia aeria F0184]